MKRLFVAITILFCSLPIIASLSLRHIYYTHNDHLGSASWITRYDGKPIQYIHYLPYGQLLANQMLSGYDERFKFIGKERDQESGYDCFGARFYISPFYHWMSVDPMVDKYLNISPYAYCHWNPITLVDINGDDDYDIDETGNVKQIITNTERDAFFIVDGEGNRINGKNLSLKYGVVESYQQGNLREGTYDAFQVRGDDNGKQLFEFLADNTSVEWGHFQIGKEGDDGLNSVSTSHQEGAEQSSIVLFNNKFRYGYYIRNHSHNHPNNTDWPSGVKKGDKGDVGFGRGLTQNAVRQRYKAPSLYIYLPATKEYIKYNSQLQTIPTMLPELDVLP